MKIEYLLFNIIAIAGPLFFAVQKKYGFSKYFLKALVSVLIVAIPYLIWDSLVTGKHWFFNDNYTLPIRIMNLPIGEILFFITIPFACIFTWEMIVQNSANRLIKKSELLIVVLLLFPVISIYTFINEHYYSTLVFIALSIAAILDVILKTKLYARKQFYFYIVLILLFTLIFNGYLTSRPVVLYGESYQVGFRVFTIPIEDFGYGISLMYFSTIIFEFLKSFNYRPAQKT